MLRAGGAHRESARSRSGGERAAAAARLVFSGRFGLHTAEGLPAPAPTPHTAVKRGAELRGQGAAGGIYDGVGNWDCPPFAPGGQLLSQPEVLSCVRGNLAKPWLDALGRGGAGTQRGRRFCCPQCRQSAPKSKAASAKNFSKAVNSSFSESDCLEFKTRSLACFWNIMLPSTNACCSLMSPKKEV